MTVVYALLLAAGASARMGTPKQVLPLGGTPALKRCVDTLFEAGIGRIIVVVSPEPPQGVTECLHDLPVTVVVNRNTGGDMASSVKAGVMALDDEAEAVLVCLSDSPLVTAATVSAMVEEHERTPEKIIVPSYRGRQGHPTLFPVRFLREMGPDDTLRDVKKKFSSFVLSFPVEDEGVVVDMDTLDDYRKVCEKVKRHGGKSCNY